MQKVMIACSPSTGSSLLRRILNRHSQIFCGSETSLLAKSDLYTNWTKNKDRLFSFFPFGLCNAAWPHQRGVVLDQDYPLNKAQIRKALSDSNTFESFIEQIASDCLTLSGKNIWIEKTPSNALSASLFLKKIPEAKVIHIYRNPYDTIASLVQRGMSPFNAVSVYVINTSSLMNLHDQRNLCALSYEDLVLRPKLTLTSLLAFLGLEFEEHMVEPRQGEEGVTKMKGWNYDETRAIGKGSISRFGKMSERVQYEILGTVSLLRYNMNGNIMSVFDVCEKLGYEYLKTPNDESLVRRLKKERIRDIINRTLKLSYFNILNYPILIRS